MCLSSLHCLKSHQRLQEQHCHYLTVISDDGDDDDSYDDVDKQDSNEDGDVNNDYVDKD